MKKPYILPFMSASFFLSKEGENKAVIIAYSSSDLLHFRFNINFGIIIALLENAKPLGGCSSSLTSNFQSCIYSLFFPNGNPGFE